MKVNILQRGETVSIWCETKTWAGAYESPSGGIVVTVVDPDGTTQVNAQAMSPDSAGKYVYYFTPDVADPLGWWSIRCKSTDGSDATIRYTIGDGGFQLE